MWLVEPRRTKAVRKFSGTLVHPSRTDKLGQTLSAFAHFVYECSGKELVLADEVGGNYMAGFFFASCIFLPTTDRGLYIKVSPAYAMHFSIYMVSNFSRTSSHRIHLYTIN